jgi:threonine dehydrogenase-like Zn-dependent dehydrogenase
LAFANALAAGVAWVEAAAPTIGDVVVVLGPGPRGVACALAAKAAGAGTVIVTGLGRDVRRLDIARVFGADVTIDVEADDLDAVVAAHSGGAGADVVIDTTPYATSVVGDAVRLARRGGTIVLAGLKGGRPAELDVDTVAMKALRLVGVRSAGSAAWRRAVHLLGDDARPWTSLHTHTFGLEAIGDAIAVQAGRVDGEQAMHVVIDPWHEVG